MICGALAGATSKTLTMPIDTVKMRLQVRIVAIATFIIIGTELYNMDIFMIDLSFSAEIQGTKLSLFLIFVYL